MLVEDGYLVFAQDPMAYYVNTDSLPTYVGSQSMGSDHCLGLNGTVRTAERRAKTIDFCPVPSCQM